MCVCVCVNLSLNILHYYCKDVTCIKRKRCGLFQVVVHILHFRLKTSTNPIKTVSVTRTAPIEIRIVCTLNTIDATATFIVVLSSFLKVTRQTVHFFIDDKRPIPNASVPLGSRFYEIVENVNIFKQI